MTAEQEVIALREKLAVRNVADRLNVRDGFMGVAPAAIEAAVRAKREYVPEVFAPDDDDMMTRIARDLATKHPKVFALKGDSAGGDDTAATGKPIDQMTIDERAADLKRRCIT